MVTVEEVDGLKQLCDPGPGVVSVDRVFHVYGDMTKSSPELTPGIPRVGDTLAGNPRYKMTKPPTAAKGIDKTGRPFWTVTATYSSE